MTIALKTNSVTSFIIAGALLIAATFSPAEANLLGNAGAESGDLSSWTPTGSEIAAVTSQDQQEGMVYPFEGSYFFTFARQPGDYEELYQTGTDSLTPDITLTLSGMVQTEDKSADDYGVATINIYDQADTIIASASTGVLTTTNLTWQQFSVQLVVPSGAAKWEIVLSGQRLYGSYINVFWDALDLSPDITSIEGAAAPAATLAQSFPNPFNPSTNITFRLPAASHTRLRVFDVRGNVVATLIDTRLGAGSHSARWDGRNDDGDRSASGMYFYQLATDHGVWTKKMVLLK